MALVQDYAILNREFSDAQNLLNTRENTYQNHIDNIIPRVEQEAIEGTRVQEFITENINTLFSRFQEHMGAESTLAEQFQERFTDAQRHIERGMPNTVRDLERAHEATNTLLSEFAEAREAFEAVEHLTAEAIITQEGLEEALYATGNIIPDSIEIHDNGADISGRPNALISWGITGITLIPNENPYSWINNGSSVAIALADVKVEIDLRTNQIYLKPFNSEEPTNLPYKYSSEFHVHPHILGHHKPCLGDWSGPVTEAICEQDWGTVSGMLTTYLSNANQRDVAGRGWFAGVIADHYSHGEYSKNSDKFIPLGELPFDASHATFDADPENPGKFIRTFLDIANQIVDPGAPPHEYAIGDIVKLRETSIHYNPRRTTGTNPADTEGKFMEYVSENGRRRLRIKWPDGINSYDRSDLEWVEEPEHILPEIITNLPQSEIQFPRSSDEELAIARQYYTAAPNNYADTSIAGRSGYDIVTDIESEVTGRIPGTPSLFD